MHSPGPYNSHYMAVSDSLSPGSAYAVRCITRADGAEISRMTPAALLGDADLFVAAPDMLEAITAYLEIFDRCGGSSAVSPEEFAAARDGLREAAAKATGAQ